MGRSHARVLTSIWADEDFCARSPGARLMYLFLLSQPDLEHSGLIGLRVERWADDLAGTEPEDLRTALEELVDSRFVIVDWRKQEVLVRSLIRRDDVWKQPNVFKSAAGSIRAVRSAAIKAALLDELGRLDLVDANKDVIGLRDELADELAAYLAGPSGNPSANPSGNPSAGPQGKGNTGSAIALPPSPSLFPDPLSPAGPPPAGAAPPRAARAPRQPSNNTGDVIASFVEGAVAAGLMRPPQDIRKRVGSQAGRLLAEKVPLQSLIDSARLMGATEFNDLAVQVRKDDARANGHGGSSAESRQQAVNDQFQRALERARQREANQ